jgi:hypothetical protein
MMPEETPASSDGSPPAGLRDVGGARRRGETARVITPVGLPGMLHSLTGRGNSKRLGTVNFGSVNSLCYHDRLARV